MRVGFGYDSHRFLEGRKFVLGGVRIEHDKGLLGHSDADALTHAIIDAIIGALGLGDIGKHFPDTDPSYKDADSMRLLRATLEMTTAAGYNVSWVDCTVLCEKPKLAPYMEDMRMSLQDAGLRGVNIKAKTNESMGFVGREQGVAVYAVCLLEKFNRTERY